MLESLRVKELEAFKAEIRQQRVSQAQALEATRQEKELKGSNARAKTKELELARSAAEADAGAAKDKATNLEAAQAKASAEFDAKIKTLEDNVRDLTEAQEKATLRHLQVVGEANGRVRDLETTKEQALKAATDLTKRVNVLEALRTHISEEFDTKLADQQAIHERAIEKMQRTYKEKIEELEHVCKAAEADARRSEEQLTELEALYVEKSKRLEVKIKTLETEHQQFIQHNAVVAEQTQTRASELETTNERALQITQALSRRVKDLEASETQISADYETKLKNLQESHQHALQTLENDKSQEVIQSRRRISKLEEALEKAQRDAVHAQDSMTDLETCHAEQAAILEEKILTLEESISGLTDERDQAASRHLEALKQVNDRVRDLETSTDEAVKCADELSDKVKQLECLREDATKTDEFNKLQVAYGEALTDAQTARARLDAVELECVQKNAQNDETAQELRAATAVLIQRDEQLLTLSKSQEVRTALATASASCGKAKSLTLAM